MSQQDRDATSDISVVVACVKLENKGLEIVLFKSQSIHRFKTSRQIMRRLILSFVIFFSFACVNSKECPTRSYLAKSLLDAHIPGAVMIVVNTTNILYQEAFGHQSFLPTQLMDVNESIFVLASISKTFIAVAAMQLVEADLLDLDKDINQYLLPSDPRISHPRYPTHVITVRQLLSHSASIASNEELEKTLFETDDRALTGTTLAEACFSYLSENASNWLPYSPSTVTLYSNVGSALAALIIERVSKTSYEYYVREKILKPLNIDIKKAAFRLSDIEDRANLVKHYAFNSSQLDEWNRYLPQINITQSAIPNWLSIPFYSVTIYPAGLLRMSAPSLSLFLRMFMNNGSSLLRTQSIAEMRTVVKDVIPYNSINPTNNTTSTPPTEFGIAWHWQTLDNNRRFLGHGGSILGATHSLLINEKGDIGVIILTNADVNPGTDQTIKIKLTINNIRLALFDCYENT